MDNPHNLNDKLEIYIEDGVAKVRLKEPITKGSLLDEHIEKLKHMSPNHPDQFDPYDDF